MYLMKASKHPGVDQFDKVANDISLPQQLERVDCRRTVQLMVRLRHYSQQHRLQLHRYAAQPVLINIAKKTCLQS